MAVTLSGFVGRYLYSQIPRNLNAAELSMKDLQEMENSLRSRLAEQKLSFGARLEALYQLPSREEVARMPLLVSLARMIWIDCKRPWRVSLLRWQASGFAVWLVSLGGLRPTQDAKLEHAIGVARKQASLSKHILFLSRTQQVFRMWHIVHRPFSYAFAILAIIHIGLALYMGYRI